MSISPSAACNRLADQTSPYLLQHASNPVDWRPWGSEAFEAAREQGKPIFLSIGYSTCYWCHVMERQVFEDASIAAALNQRFVSIKVDREERPDVDDLYMTATQLMTGRGGWPMSVFLTPPGATGPDDPGLRPFYAGTYFPPRPMGGMPGFPQVVEGLSQAWHERRDEVLHQADVMAQAVRDHFARAPEAGGLEPPGLTPELSPDSIQHAANQLLRLYDPKHGGFSGPNGPKFPTPNNLAFLLAVWRNNPDDDLRQGIIHTLDRMARGGIYDQVGGGFHRYSVDERWLVPHFEKMLYDNAQLVELYLQSKPVLTAESEYAWPRAARVARETCDYVLREMLDDTGAFWSAQDAEVAGHEGANYVWTRDQVEQAIDDPDLAELAVQMYGLDQPPNFQDPHHPDDPPAHVLYLPRPLSDLGDLGEVAAKRQAINGALKAVRDRRDQPATDDKVILSWNGMMIAALAQAGGALNEPTYVDAAARAAEVVIDRMTADPADGGGLQRTLRRGEAKIPAFLEDYAFFVHGLIELHRARPNQRRWLDLARRYTADAIERFASDAGGYFDTAVDARTDLFVRVRSTQDGAMPSGNSQMIHNLLDLYQATGEKLYLHRALNDLRSFAGELDRQGANMAHMQHALLRALEMTSDESRRHARSASARQVVDATVEQVSASGTTATIRIVLSIEAGHHINANPAGPALVATTLELAPTPGVTAEVDYPRGQTKTYPFADQPLPVYEGRVVVPVTLLAQTALPDQVTLFITFQACTESACLPPRTIELPASL